MREFLQRTRYWWLYLSIAIGVWVLGTIGYLGYYDASASWIDAAYDSFKLFKLGYGHEPLGAFTAEPLLQFSRIAAPVVVGIGALLALVALFRDEFRRLKARYFWKDHVVVCGLGTKGFRLAKDFWETGCKVAVVEKDPDNPLLGSCREMGAALVVGDARHAESLRAAGVGRAEQLIAVCGEDGVNVEVALQASRAAEGREADPLHIASHVTDPHLCRLLKERDWEGRRGGGFRLEFFNIYNDGATALLRMYPPFAAVPRGEAPRILVVGLGRVSQALVRDLARRWARERGDGGRLRLAIADQELGRAWPEFARRVPYLESVCAIEIHALDRDALTSSPALVARELGPTPPAAAYVALENDSASASAALALRSAYEGALFPIVCVLENDVGLAALIERIDRGRLHNLHAFPLAERTCTCGLVLQSETEILARANHEHYRAFRARSTDGRPADASLAPWDELPEPLKESNRQFVDHVFEKLRAIGYRVVPLEDWRAEPAALAPDEIELLARIEHERFVAERVRDGWVRGEKDLDRKRHPDLVPWEELAEPIRDYDRELVRRIPDLLLSVDRTLRRVEL